MNARRLAELLDVYGADPQRWPEDERAAAETLLATSPELRARAETAASLDALLDAAPAAPAPSAALRDRILASAPRVDTAGPEPAAAPRHANVRPSTVSRLEPRRRRWLAAVALPLAAALLLWLTRSPAPQTQLAAVRSTNLAKLEEIELPTDDLLALNDDDTGQSISAYVLDEMPDIGCADGTGLGCPDLDELFDAQSRTITPSGRITA